MARSRLVERKSEVRWRKPSRPPSSAAKSAKNQKNGRKRRIRSCAHFRPPDDPAIAREIPLGNYQPTVTVAIVGAAVCSDELKPPTSSYAKPYDSALMLWSCQNFEYEFDGDA